MALEHLSIRNFQSLHAIDIEVAPFTVIVGRSSSGKSAFIRALHTLANNRRGLSFLTHGERVCTISARTTAGTTVTLSRAKATDENYYDVIPSHDPSAKQRYSKLDGKTPQPVIDALGMHPQRSFAAQHDMPYLLDDSGPSNAAVLGALTNVNVIFEAARESKRRALEASKTLRLRATDLQSTTEALTHFEHLDEQQDALTEAEKKISAAYAAQRELTSITTARDALTSAAATYKRLSTAAAIDIPDMQPLMDAHQSLTALHTARGALMAAATEHKAAQAVLVDLSSEQQALDDEWVAMRANTAAVFRSAFEQQYTGSDDDGHYIHTDRAASIAAETVESISA